MKYSDKYGYGKRLDKRLIGDFLTNYHLEKSVLCISISAYNPL